jgi:hypothetical protein
MRHQNCDIDHSNIGQVKACIATKRLGRPVITTALHLATQKQQDFLRALMEQTGTEEADLPCPVEELTKRQASEEIMRLKNKKKELGKQVNDMEFLGANVPATAQVPQGTYTVVFDAESDDRLTLRFRVPRYGKWEGVQLVEYLYGPDNDNDYRRCANWTDGGYRVWNAFANQKSRIAAAIDFLAHPDSRSEAGMLYAIASSNCYRCGRTLTVPVSVGRGLGPDCASQIGVA